MGGYYGIPNPLSIGGSTLNSYGTTALLITPAGNKIRVVNGANPQIFEIYKTTDSDTAPANFERCTFGYSAGTYFLRTTQAGTGAAQPLNLGAFGAADVVIGSNQTAVTAQIVITGATGRLTLTPTDGVISLAGALTASGNYRFSHGTAALAVGATEGFFHLQSCAGLPTGTPATIPSGQIPLVINSVTGQLNLYSAAWLALPRTLDVNVTAVGNVGAGTDDLITYAIPANTLAANGKTVRVKAWGTTANNANGKTVTFVVGSQTVLTTALTTSIAGQWEIEVYIVRTGSNTQDIRARLLQGATVIFDQELTAGTQTDTAGITIKCTGAATSNNDIVQEGMITELLN